jgi:hypothetical protein
MPLSTYRRGLFLGAFLLLLSCSGGPSEDDLQFLEGYWEISRVQFPDGSEKLYEASTNIDYFNWDGRDGFRKKMQPTLEGTYLTSDDALPMEVIWRDKRLFLSFRGEGDPWEEEVIRLQQDLLVTLHANGLRYEYSRYKPLLTTQ